MIGPSGSGKSTLAKALHELGLVDINPTDTDRPRRKSEEEFEHRFLTSSEFDMALKEGRYLGTVQPFGLEFRYGLPSIEQWQKVQLVMLRVQFLRLFSEHFSKFVVYHVEAPRAQVEEALKTRGHEDHGSRLDDYDFECELGRQEANRFFVNNAEMSSLVEAVKQSIIKDYSLSST